jgi:glycosyltransferase involved in cell wall biosynthesis
MRLALCAAQIPFMKGGAEYLCDNLYRALIDRGHEVENVKVPFQWQPPQEIINSALSWRLLDLSESAGRKIDGVIATKFPSYSVRHENKVVWLIHQHRPAYDLSDTKFDNLGSYKGVGEAVRKKIKHMDNRFLGEARCIYTISRNVAERLWRYNGLQGNVVYPPPPMVGRYRSESYGDYIFYPSRLDALKRQELVIESMKHVISGLRLKIAGTGYYLDHLRKVAKDNNVEDRVDFLGHVSNEDLIELYANALCIPYVPVDEDLGFIAMESFFSKRPVITCTDSGGSLEFVKNGVNGYVVEPKPDRIAERINALSDKNLARRLGQNGYEKVCDMKLSWDNVVKELLRPME